MNKIRVFIVDDHPVVREGLPQLLESQEDLQVVGNAENGEKALEKLRSIDADVIILDISMPLMNA